MRRRIGPGPVPLRSLRSLPGTGRPLDGKPGHFQWPRPGHFQWPLTEAPPEVVKLTPRRPRSGEAHPARVELPPWRLLPRGRGGLSCPQVGEGAFEARDPLRQCVEIGARGGEFGASDSLSIQADSCEGYSNSEDGVELWRHEQDSGAPVSSPACGAGGQVLQCRCPHRPAGQGGMVGGPPGPRPVGLATRWARDCRGDARGEAQAGEDAGAPWSPRLMGPGFH